MGNAQSVPRHNLYITKVSNMDLPLCPFIHAIVGCNEIPVEDIDPLALKQVLASQDLLLEALDVRDGTKFRLRVPRGTERLGINVIKLASVPELMKMQVTAVKESSSTPLKAGDQILGIEGRYCDIEDEVIYHIKSGGGTRLAVLRDSLVESIELTSTELGCEMGIGILYKARGIDCYMKSYNGKVQRECIGKAKHPESSDTYSGNRAGETEPASSHIGKQSTAEDDLSDLNSRVEDLRVSGSGDSVDSKDPCAGSSSHQPELDNEGTLPCTMDRAAEGDESCTASHVIQDKTLDRKNYDLIFSEANLPKETEYFGGERLYDKEAVNILNQTFVSKEDFVESDGEQRMKEDVYVQRMENADGIRALFEEEDDDLPFGDGSHAEECQDI